MDSYHLKLCISIGLLLGLSAPAQAQDASASTSNQAAAALDSIFNVRTAPDAKSMGIFQGSFLDAIRPEVPNTQLAFLVDVTESMADQLPGIREKIPQVVGDIERASGNKVEVAIVSFADSGTADKPLSGIEAGFTHDREQIQKMVDVLKPRSGRPYFPEAVDLAIFKSLKQLPWSEDEAAHRMIFLISDAPPYDAAFEEEKTASRRWYDTDALVNLANHSGIQVHCLLCESRPEEKEAFSAVVDKTRNFMGQLSSRTGGLMLDLSFSQVRDKVVKASNRPRAEFAFVGAIRDQDVEALLNTTQQKVGDLANLRIAVMPHVGWNDMTFYHEVPGVQFSTQLRYSLKRLPGLRVVSSRDIESEFLRLKSGAVPVEQWPQALCLRLRADLLITGDVRTRGEVSDVQSRIYVPDSDKPIAAISASGTPDILMASFLQAVQQTQSTNPSLIVLNKALGTEQATDLRQFWPGVLSELEPFDQRTLISAMSLIEESIDVTLPADEREESLATAIDLLEPLSQAGDSSAFSFLLSASAHFNLAKVHEVQGQLTDAKKQMSNAIVYLKKAFDGRRAINDRLLQTEIEADHALLVRRDFSAAQRRYKEIAEFTEASQLHMALRAHWMLAGIECGDWGAAESKDFKADPQSAREHLIHILAFWPESDEARVIQKYMRWDHSDGKTNVPYFPREGELLLTAN